MLAAMTAAPLRGFLVDFCFLSTSQEIRWEERLPNDRFCVEWDVKP